MQRRLYRCIFPISKLGLTTPPVIIQTIQTSAGGGQGQGISKISKFHIGALDIVIDSEVVRNILSRELEDLMAIDGA